MIPATLPAPAPEAAGTPGPRPDHATGHDFERALDRAARGDDPITDDACPSPDDAGEDAPEIPGGDGRAQALASMPVDVPARPVVAGTAHDARPTEDPTGTASPAAAPVSETGSPSVAPVSGAGSPSVPPVSETGSPSVAAVPEDGASAAPAAEISAEAAPVDPQPTDDGVDDLRPSVRPEQGTDEIGEAKAPGNAGTASSERVDDGAPSRTEGVDDGPVPTSREVPGDVAAPREAAPRPAPPAADVVSTHVDPVGPPVATAPTSGAPDVAPTSTPAPPPPPVAEQLVAHVTPLAAGPDGTQELTIELRPVELGHVRLEVTLDDGVVSVRVHAEDPASRRLLAQSLGDLRHALVEAGISAGSLDVGDPRSGAGAGDGEAPHDRRAERPAETSGDGAGRVTERAAAHRRVPSRSAVDVLL